MRIAISMQCLLTSMRSIPSRTQRIPVLLHRPNIPQPSSSSISRTHAALFSSTTPSLARGRNKGPKKDSRITQIRYHLQHPRTPRPLRFSRLRALRHWTIHRAWQLYRAQQRRAQELELERQYNSMRDACEALRLIGEDGMEGGKDAGRLYRIAMEKRGVWGEGGVPIEYARAQTDFPSREGWNHGWTR